MVQKLQWSDHEHAEVDNKINVWLRLACRKACVHFMLLTANVYHLFQLAN
jgi:hypothetical protein